MSERLEDIAVAMVANGKGILAADESSGTIKKRFDVIGVESTADSRRDYREMMFRTKEAMTKYISGVILYDETIRQSAADGTPLVELIKASGAIPGIKVDAGAKGIVNFPGDTITEGLDGLRERMAEYYKLGARFAKWRAVIDIDTTRNVPSAYSLSANTQALARYAALCQEAGIVPIVEPEVLMDGAHDIDTCYDVTKATLVKLYDELYAARVVLEGTILKPNMVISGKKAARQARAEEISDVLRVARVGMPDRSRGGRARLDPDAYRLELVLAERRQAARHGSSRDREAAGAGCRGELVEEEAPVGTAGEDARERAAERRRLDQVRVGHVGSQVEAALL